MAAATVYSTSYGYRVTGDTGAVTVTTQPVWVKAWVWIPQVGNDTYVATDAGGNAIFEDTGATAATAYVRNVGGNSGVKYDGIKISSLSNGADVLYIIVR